MFYPIQEPKIKEMLTVDSSRSYIREKKETLTFMHSPEIYCETNFILLPRSLYSLND